MLDAKSLAARRRTILIFHDRGPARGVVPADGQPLRPRRPLRSLLGPRAPARPMGARRRDRARARAAPHRDQRLAPVRLCRRHDRIGAGGTDRRARPDAVRAPRARRNAAGPLAGDAHAGGNGALPRHRTPHPRDHRRGAVDRRRHAGEDDDRRRRLVDAPEGRRTRVADLVPPFGRRHPPPGRGCSKATP
ncbi:hypothetical protein AB5I41_05935 [Sphingomonas sp. MMS24-JH45]